MFDGIYGWLRDVAVFFILMTAVLNILPEAKYRIAVERVTENADFAEKSQAKGRKSTDGLWPKGDRLYDYINDLGEVRERVGLERAASGGTQWAIYVFLSDQEKGIYNYLYETQG